ncbi:MAG: FecR domain-containing protein [Bacteroidota bacterium]
MQDLIDDIIIRKLNNEPLTFYELIKLNQWLSRNARNRKIYSQLKLMIVQRSTNAKNDVFKTEIWNNLQQRRALAKPIRSAPKVRPINTRMWLKVAASIAVFFVFFMLSQKIEVWKAPQSNSKTQVGLIEKVALPGQRITTRLADGTSVQLNADSKIKVPEVFEGQERRIELDGEAFFDVKRDAERPFIIDTKEMHIQVIGTSFNVRTSEGGLPGVVYVKSGKVEVSNAASATITLTKGEMVAVDKVRGLVKSQIEDYELAFGWTNKKLVFRDSNIQSVFNAISKWFGVEITVLKRFSKPIPFTAKFQNPTLKEVMESLAHVYELNYEITENEITIK